MSALTRDVFSLEERPVRAVPVPVRAAPAGPCEELWRQRMPGCSCSHTRVGAGAAHTAQMKAIARLHKLKRADVVQTMNKQVSLGTDGNCLRIPAESGFCRSLGFFLLFYWEAGSLNLILGTEIEPIVSHT